MKRPRFTSITLLLAAIFFAVGGFFALWGRFFADSGRYLLRSGVDSISNSGTESTVFLPLETPEARERLHKGAENYLNAEKSRLGADFDPNFYGHLVQDGFARLDRPEKRQNRFTTTEILGLFAETSAESDDSLAEAAAFLTEFAPADLSNDQTPAETAQISCFLPETWAAANPLNAIRLFSTADLTSIPTESARLANELITPISFRAGLLFSILSLALSFLQGEGVLRIVPESLDRSLAEFFALIRQIVRAWAVSFMNTRFAFSGGWKIFEFFAPNSMLAERTTVVLLI